MSCPPFRSGQAGEFANEPRTNFDEPCPPGAAKTGTKTPACHATKQREG